LVVLGVIYNNGLTIKPLSETRLPSVLGRIGLAYMFANIIYLYFKHNIQVLWFFALLFGYWALLAFGSAPGFQAGDLTMEGNMASYIDRMIIPGKLYLGIHDPEGLVSTIPAISTGLLGIMTGDFLKNSKQEPLKKVYWMIGLGISLVILAHVWNFVLPINKNLWTSSFVFNTGGYSLILLGIFYFIIDVKQIRGWDFFFRMIGMNSILIYISSVFIDWEFSTKAFFGWIAQLTGDSYQMVVLGIALVFLKWLFLLFMYRKKVFLRV
jgi:predicted acyltransferase